MPRKVPLPPQLTGTAFRIWDAASHGMTRGRLRGADVTHPFRGIGAIGLDLSTAYGRCLAYEPRLAAGHYFSHQTAADLYGMPLPPVVDAAVDAAGSIKPGTLPLHVSVLGRRTPPEGRGLVGHALTASDVGTRLVLGLPVVDPADTWCHLAPSLSREDLAAVGDFLISGRPLGHGRREPPLATIEQLTIAVERHSGRRGAKVLRWGRVIRVTADDLFVFPERLIARVWRIVRERGTVHPVN